MARNKLTASQRRQRYNRRKALGILCVSITLAIIIAADRLGFFGRKVLPDATRYDGKTFRVVKVIDGDTIDVDAPDGRYRNTRIRFWGVDTPEIAKAERPDDHFGPQAHQFTRELCLNQQVRLELEPLGPTRGTHGRLLAWVFLPDGRLLNRLLVEKGLAYADPRFEHHLHREFARLQRQARKAGYGLWKDVQPTDLPYYYQRPPHKLKGR